MSMERHTWRVDHFDLDKIAESGQVFRWERLGPRHYVIPMGSLVAVARQPDAEVLELDCTAGAAGAWREYFALNDDYAGYWQTINAWAKYDGPDAYLTRAVRAADGIVVLHQPDWETAVSFMVSQNNNIPRIRGTVKELSKRQGRHITAPPPVGEYWTFPSPAALMEPDALQGVGLGYREKYVTALAGAVRSGGLDLFAISVSDYAEAKAELMEVPGIGEKVANCILLYGMHFLDAFPVDTWIHRILEREFSGAFPLERYRGFNGLIQQMIFYYERKETKR